MAGAERPWSSEVGCWWHTVVDLPHLGPFPRPSSAAGLIDSAAGGRIWCFRIQGWKGLRMIPDSNSLFLGNY